MARASSSEPTWHREMSIGLLWDTKLLLIMASSYPTALTQCLFRHLRTNLAGSSTAIISSPSGPLMTSVDGRECSQSTAVQHDSDSVAVGPCYGRKVQHSSSHVRCSTQPAEWHHALRHINVLACGSVLERFDNGVRHFAREYWCYVSKVPMPRILAARNNWRGRSLPGAMQLALRGRRPWSDAGSKGKPRRRRSMGLPLT